MPGGPGARVAQGGLVRAASSWRQNIGRSAASCVGNPQPPSGAGSGRGQAAGEGDGLDGLDGLDEPDEAADPEVEDEPEPEELPSLGLEVLLADSLFAPLEAPSFCPFWLRLSFR